MPQLPRNGSLHDLSAEGRGPASAGPRHPPLVVGIGASAGGLEAFCTFFAHMPADDDFAFVLVQHLSPEHVSALADILSRSTSMSVVEAFDGQRVLAKHVYVIPPDATLTILNGELQVSTPAPPATAAMAHQYVF